MANQKASPKHSVYYLQFTCTSRLNDKVQQLHNNLTKSDDGISEIYKNGLVGGFTKETFVCF